mgnify:CR=1 FL=1
MGHLSTHVLDTMNGCPAAGMAVKLQRREGTHFETIVNFALNADGRNAGGALLDSTAMAAGCLAAREGSSEPTDVDQGNCAPCTRCSGW